MLKYLLHATDLAEEHLDYFESSIQIARQLHAELFVLHVLEQPKTWQLAQGLGLIENIPLPQEDSLLVMQTLAKEYKLNPDHMLVIQGSPKHKILECSHELQIDLLLIGAPSNPVLQGELSHLSHYLIDHAPCDVMLLHKH
jgi:universal stress protein A